MSRWVLRAMLAVAAVLVFRAVPLGLLSQILSTGHARNRTDIEAFITREIFPVLDDTLAFLDHRHNSPAGQHGEPATLPLVPTVNASGSSHLKVCAKLHGKTIYLVGPPHTTYKLHDYLISILTPLGTRQPFCAGPAVCVFHVICQPSDASLTLPPHPKPSSIAGVKMSLLRFIPSTTLYASPNRFEEAFDSPQVDRRTGVRIVQDPWTAAVAKANVLVLSRAPLPAPAWSYNANEGVKWDWLEKIGQVERGDPERGFEVFTEKLRCLPIAMPTQVPQPERVLRAALHTTLAVFLPSVLGVLADIQRHVDFAPIFGKKTVIWHGSWFLPVHSIEGLYRNGGLELLAEQLANAEEPWSGYYNAQVLMHDYILPKILREYGIVYLQLSTVGTRLESSVQNEEAFVEGFLDNLYDLLSP
ncbi:hypothetical protein K488DRAFT_90755 [Vararia minispora EC-137]|uniref:Uncharacterized protein n=1 Tax=Vararia minispora EC-137 TaxID=1314806 RepID=A0ACB8Q763_9AGAM|nr:hypothetical protein K488DRAFT_90755 [Vararia minispora EC-137]